MYDNLSRRLFLDWPRLRKVAGSGRMRAAEERNDWRVQGESMFSSGCVYADSIINERKHLHRALRFKALVCLKNYFEDVLSRPPAFCQRWRL